MLLHECDEVGFGEQLGRAGLPIHHLHSARLEAGASFIDGKGLQEQQKRQSDGYAMTPGKDTF